MSLYKIVFDSVAPLTSGASIASVLIDSAGNLLQSLTTSNGQSLSVNLSSEYVQDTAFDPSQYGAQIWAVRHDANTTIATLDGNMAPFQLDANGALKVSGSFSVSFTAEHNEDAASSSGDSLIGIAAVRQDVLATDTSATGDYSFVKVDALGELYVHDTDVKAQLVSANVSLSSLATLVKAEDAAASSGDPGVQPLLVRQDTLAASTSADGDYGSFKSNNLGELYVHDTDVKAQLVSANSSLSTIAAGLKAEDSVAASGDSGMPAWAVRRDAAVSSVSAAGDYSEIQVSGTGEVRTMLAHDSGLLQQVITVATVTAAAIPASPLANRKSILVQNLSDKVIYVGSSTTTADQAATGGYEIPNGGEREFLYGPNTVLYAICGTAGKKIAVIESR